MYRHNLADWESHHIPSRSSPANTKIPLHTKFFNVMLPLPLSGIFLLLSSEHHQN